MNIVRSENIGKSEAWITRHHIDSFAVQEALCGFLLDEVINPKGEFHSDPRISVARAEQKKRRKNDDDDDD